MIESHDLFQDVKLGVERQVLVALPSNYIYELFEGRVIEDCKLTLELQIVCSDVVILFIYFLRMFSLLQQLLLNLQEVARFLLLVDLQHFTSHSTLHILFKGLLIWLVSDEFCILLFIETVQESILDVGPVLTLFINQSMLCSY